MRRQNGKFCRDSRGIAAVEFALFMPLLPLLFLGMIEVLTLYRTEAKLNALTTNVAQMVSISQEVGSDQGSVPASSSTINVTALNDICQLAILGLKPFPPSNLTIDIASVTEESGPNGLPQSSSAYSATPSYDIWESDASVVGGNCTQAGNSSALTSLTAGSMPLPFTKAGLINYPCNNTIIVRATLQYPGLLGFVLMNRPILTQTAYVSWAYSTNPTVELLCPNCTLTTAAKQVCNSSNTATN